MVPSMKVRPQLVILLCRCVIFHFYSWYYSITYLFKFLSLQWDWTSSGIKPLEFRCSSSSNHAGHGHLYLSVCCKEVTAFLHYPDGGSLKVSDEALIADPGWQLYRKSLENRGYFRGLLEGSRDYKQLLQAAIGGYRGSQAFATTRYSS